LGPEDRVIAQLVEVLGPHRGSYGT
jgi:hypothetical protein